MRKRPYQVNLLLGGYDADDGASLYYIDYMGTKQKTNYAAHGYCANFVLSVMDRHWKVRARVCVRPLGDSAGRALQAGMTLAEGLDLVRKCIHELQTRFMLNQKAFMVKIVDAAGVRIVDLAAPDADAAPPA